LPFAPRAIFYALCMLLCLAATPLQAQETTKERALSLQSHFQNVLENRQKNIENATNAQRTLKLEGRVSVEPADGYYAITLPPMRMIRQDQTETRIGMISMNASEHKASRLKVTLALPTSILGLDADGQEAVRITIQEQKTAGIWHEELESFIKLDAHYKDVRIEASGGETTLRLPEILVRYNLEEDEDKRWSGPTWIQANNITLDTKNENISSIIENITFSTHIDKFSAQALKSVQEASPVNITENLNMADGMKTRLNINGVKLSTTEQTLSLDNTAFLMSFDDALSDTANIQFGFSFKGANSTDISDDLKSLAPRNANFSLTHNNIPLAQIQEILLNSAPTNAQMAGFSTLLKLPAILSQAGSTIELQNTFMSNDQYRMDLDSTVRADITAAHSATLTGTLAVSGLDKILSILQVSATNSQTEKHGTFMRTLARFLERLKPISKIKTNPEKGFVHVFDFEVGKDGQLLVNGQNATTLLDKEPNPPAPETNLNLP